LVISCITFFVSFFLKHFHFSVLRGFT
jgi:hypothetical protein